MIGNPSYPTYQIFLALFVAAVLTAALMPAWIKLMRYRQIGQQVRADGPQRHLIKQGTPTMGGVVMVIALVITSLVFSRRSLSLDIVLAATVLTALLGFIDDITSVSHGRSLGLTARAKLFGQFLICLGFTVVAVNYGGIEPSVNFFNIGSINLSALTTTIGGISIPWLYLVFVFLMLAGFSNAVNLTDGLDGLAAGTVMFALGVMAMIAFNEGMLDIAVFAAAAAGTCVGFLWFNCHPADIFMGDTGSLALGTGFAAVAIVTGSEVFSLIIGALFIAEALSVIIQVVSFKATGKRVFLMAPIHHHYEKKGMSETKVVIRFWIVTGACAALGFALYFQIM